MWSPYLVFMQHIIHVSLRTYAGINCYKSETCLKCWQFCINSGPPVISSSIIQRTMVLCCLCGLYFYICCLGSMKHNMTAPLGFSLTFHFSKWFCLSPFFSLSKADPGINIILLHIHKVLPLPLYKVTWFIFHQKCPEKFFPVSLVVSVLIAVWKKMTCLYICI